LIIFCCALVFCLCMNVCGAVVGACNENNGTTLCELFWSAAFFPLRREREREMHVPLRLRSHAAHYLLFHLSSRIVVILSD
jgi:hypothetical protein